MTAFAHPDDSRHPRIPVGLLLLVALAALFGLTSTVASVQTSKQTASARKVDVDRNARLIAEVGDALAAKEDRHYACLVKLGRSLADPHRDPTIAVPDPCPPTAKSAPSPTTIPVPDDRGHSVPPVAVGFAALSIIGTVLIWRARRREDRARSS